MIRPSLIAATKKTFLLLILTFFIGQVPFVLLAQENSNGGNEMMKESLDDLSLVGGFGVGGAILGLSTLSFTSVPTKNLNNILIGASLGIIIGVGVVAWGQASRSHEVLMGSQPTYQKRGTITYWPISVSDQKGIVSNRPIPWKDGPFFSFSYPF